MCRSLKLLLGFLVCKLGAWLLMCPTPAPRQYVCCVFCDVQLAAFAIFLSFPKRQATCLFILCAFLSIFTSRAAFAPAQQRLQIAPPVAVIPPPVPIYRHSHTIIPQLSFIPLQTSQIRPPPAIPTTSSPFLKITAFPRQCTCAPFLPATTYLDTASAALFNQSRLLILVLLTHLVPVLSFWLSCAQHRVELHSWPHVVRWYHLQCMS